MPESHNTGRIIGIVLLLIGPFLIAVAVAMLVIGLFASLGWVYGSIAVFAVAFAALVAGAILLGTSTSHAWSFNAPPGWPIPPGGWQLVPGWQPDPSWPAVPDNWTWWVRV